MLELRKLPRPHLWTRPAAYSAVFPMVMLLLFFGLACPHGRADVGVVLNESLDTSMDRITGTGHSSVYFSRICPESPVRLRLCHPGEQGSIMSNYINLGEHQRFEWNVVPLNVYLYGVEDARHRPIFGSFRLKHLLEDRYRRNYLADLCAGEPCATSYKAEWREMVAATFVRTVYIFAVDTTIEQDKSFIAQFNEAQNKSRFNGVTRNCADFTMRVMNTYFPHSTHPDYVNDFGMTSPKAVARSFTHYALQHPQSHLRVLHFAQAPGTIKRSREVRAGTEQLYRSKKFLIPMIVFAGPEVPAVATTYVLTGRFNPEREFEEHAALSSATKENPPTKQLVAAAQPGPAQIVGSSEEWKAYRKAFDTITTKHGQNEVSYDRRELNRFFRMLDKAGTPFLDEDGSAWMEIRGQRTTVRVGLSASNTLEQGSDPGLAYELLLARVNYVLECPKHSREAMTEFKQDWAAMQRASISNILVLARSAHDKSGYPGAMPEGGND